MDFYNDNNNEVILECPGQISIFELLELENE